MLKVVLDVLALISFAVSVSQQRVCQLLSQPHEVLTTPGVAAPVVRAIQPGIEGHKVPLQYFESQLGKPDLQRVLVGPNTINVCSKVQQ